MKRKLVCFFDDMGFYNLNRLSNIVIDNKEFDLKYVHALLNSQLLDFYFNTVFNEYEVKPIHLGQLPIKVSNNSTALSSLVNQILDLKKADPKADTSALEAQIDQLVYALYGLTDEEIAIVEGAVG
jgi:adenine-specific DNA-methyltransferase